MMRLNKTKKEKIKISARYLLIFFIKPFISSFSLAFLEEPHHFHHYSNKE